MSNVFDKYQKGATPSNVGVAVDDTNVFSKYQKGATPSNVGVAVDDTNVFLKYQGTMRRPQEPAQPAQPAQPTSLISNIFGDIKTGLQKAPARLAGAAVTLIAQLADFTGDFLARTVEERVLRHPAGSDVKFKKSEGYAFDQTRADEMADRWANFYSSTVGAKTEEFKQFAASLRQRESVQPTEEWSNTSTAEKFKPEHIAETFFFVGPDVAASFGAFYINPTAGFALTSGAVADDIKTLAMENGVQEDAANVLGIGTGLVVGVLEKIVPDEVFSKQQKSKFIAGLAKRLFRVGKTAGKEIATEVAQENITIAVESTLREDLGWEEIKARNAMSAFGGLIGGVGAQTMVDAVNSVRNEAGVGTGKEITTLAEPQPAVSKDAQVTTLADDNVFAKYQPAAEEAVVAPVEKKPVKVTPVKKKKVAAVKPKPTPTPEVIKVPATQLPVGEGKEKVSRLEARVKGKLDILKTVDVETAKNELGLSTYNQLTRADQRIKAADYVANNTEEAMQVMRGEIDPPAGLINSAVYVALKELGTANTELATQLATLAATRQGQEVNYLQEIDPDNPVSKMESIVKTKIKAYEKRTGRKVQDKIDAEVKKINRETKTPTQHDWLGFLESIKC